MPQRCQNFVKIDEISGRKFQRNFRPDLVDGIPEADFRRRRSGGGENRPIFRFLRIFSRRKCSKGLEFLTISSKFVGVRDGDFQQIAFAAVGRFNFEGW